MRSLKIALGSTNPVKISAARKVFGDLYGTQIEIHPLEVGEGLPPQPFNSEVLLGAILRAKRALRALPDADFGVGMEGGVVELWGRAFILGFAAVADRSGRLGVGSSGWFECPPGVHRELISGRVLGEVMEELTGVKEIGKKEGAAGILTCGRVTREELFKHGLFLAMARFLRSELFEEEI